MKYEKMLNDVMKMSERLKDFCKDYEFAREFEFSMKYQELWKDVTAEEMVWFSEFQDNFREAKDIIEGMFHTENEDDKFSCSDYAHNEYRFAKCIHALESIDSETDYYDYCGFPVIRRYERLAEEKGIK